VSDPLTVLAGRLGILPRFQDQTGIWHDTTPETRAALITAMGFDPTRAQAELAQLRSREEARVLPDWLVCVADQAGPVLPHRWTLTTEDGAKTEGRGALPVLPLGRHQLEIAGHTTWLLCAPETLPEPPRCWGMTLPLYGLRPAEDGGVGSYGDLAEAAAGLGGLGAAFVGINPVHAGFPCDAMAFSPYAPSSRRRFSTLHIEAGAQVGPSDLVDYPAFTAAQTAALRALYATTGADPAIDLWIATEGQALRRFALHQALSDEFGAYWPDWPAGFHSPDTPEVEDFADLNPDALRFHGWCQWLAEQQLAGVAKACDGMALGLYLDLAVGTHPHGAETWGDPDLFAPGCSLGAPPDAFSRGGQTWNLAPMRPLHLAATGFAALADILRAQLRFARVLRIDHILGFDRAFWVPDGGPGAYVQMPKAALLAVARIEAARVGAVIVGEDLGNIPKGLQADLEASGILGCRVAMFERDWNAAVPVFSPAGTYPRRALSSVATHDLPTHAGWRVGRDIDWRRDTGALDGAEHALAMTLRMVEVEAFDAMVGGPTGDNAHGFLAATPSRLVAVQAEDALGLIEQPNLPGTVYDHPNWRRRLGVSAGDLARHTGVVAAAETMKKRE